MIPYILLYLFVIFIIIIENFNEYKKINLKLIISIVFCIFYSIREFVGYDYTMYYNIIDKGMHEGYLYRNEYLSYFFMDIANYFNEPRVFFALVAIIALPLYIYFFYNYACKRNMLGWSMLIFMALPIGFMQTLSVSRQFIAAAIVLFATKYIVSLNFKKYIFCIFIATMFHFTSIVLIILYIVNMKWFKYKYIIILGIIINVFIALIVMIIENYFVTYIDYVLNDNIYNNGFSQSFLYIFMGVIFIGIRNLYKDNRIYDICLKNYLIGLIFVIAFMGKAGLLGIRIGFVELTYGIILLTYFINSIRYNLVIKYICYIILSMMFFYNLYLSNIGTYIPYRSFIF